MSCSAENRWKILEYRQQAKYYVAFIQILSYSLLLNNWEQDKKLIWQLTIFNSDCNLFWTEPALGVAPFKILYQYYKDFLGLFIKSLDVFFAEVLFCIVTLQLNSIKFSYCIDLICDCSQDLAVLIDSNGFIPKISPETSRLGWNS